MTEKKEKKFKPAKDGEWIQPKMRNYLMKCCDCGLVHKLNFKIVSGRRRGRTIERVQFQAFRGEAGLFVGGIRWIR